ncbi:hypothetical protein Esti_001763 [Eimeria stiedai]
MDRAFSWQQRLQQQQQQQQEPPPLQWERAVASPWNTTQQRQRPWRSQQQEGCTYTAEEDAAQQQETPLKPSEEAGYSQQWARQQNVDEAAYWQQQQQEEDQQQMLLQQQWEELSASTDCRSETPSVFAQQQQQRQKQKQQSSLCTQSSYSHWQQQQPQHQQQETQWNEQTESGAFESQHQTSFHPHPPSRPPELLRRRQWQQQQQQQQEWEQQQQHGLSSTFGASSRQQVHGGAAAPRSKRVWGAARASAPAAATTAAAVSTPAASAAAATGTLHALPPSSLRPRAFTRVDSSSRSSSKRECGLSFEGVTSATAAAAIASAVMLAAAKETPGVLAPPVAERHLPGPAGRWLRRRQQHERGKRSKTIQQVGDSPFGAETGPHRSADISQSSAAAAVAAAAAAPGFTPCPGCWGGAWLGLSHYDAAAADAGTTAATTATAVAEQKAPLRFSASWARALLFLGLPFDAFHLGLTPTPSPCPSIMSFLVKSNVAAVLRHSEAPVKKVPHLLLFLKHVVMGDNEGALTDRVFVAADPTGEAACSVHSSVSDFQHLCPGSTVVLQEASVYYAAFKLPYIIITPRCLVKAFPPSFTDDTLRQQAEEARDEWEYRGKAGFKTSALLWMSLCAVGGLAW